MSPCLRRLPGAGAALLAIVFLSAESLTIDESELECEQAVAHVEQCCPGFPHSLPHCVRTACTATPDLTISQSRCLQALDCDPLVAAGVCDGSRWPMPKPDASTSILPARWRLCE